MEPKLTPVLEIAKGILKQAGLKGMHVSEIAKIAVSKNNNMSLPEPAFQTKLQAALAGNLKLKTQKPTFATVKWDVGQRKGKPRQGWYRLKVEKSPSAAAQIEPPKTDKAFTGKAGEYAVMSELLFWEYNASVMAVDDGIDLVASKDNRYFHIQVKTATEQEGGKFSFTIKHSSFKEHDSTTMFYVFVLRRGLRNEYVIIPSGYLRTLIAGGRIATAPMLSVTIASDPRGIKYMLNASVDVSLYFGNFGGIIA
jgi:hypothetical protein